MTSTDTDQLPLLVPTAARTAHTRLLDALGTETDPARWMSFMETVTELMPEILSPGRPSAESIRRSIIGQLGHASWREMVEAPVGRGGLGWTWGGWKGWRRAWATVVAHPWLRQQALTASQVTQLAQRAQAAGRPFPSSPAALEALEADREARRERARSDGVSALQDRLAEQQQALEAAREAAAAARGQVEALQAQLAEARAQTAELGAVRRDAEGLRRALSREQAARREAAQALQALRSRSRWQQLLHALGIAR